jgi:hypothetical protein
MFAPFNPELLGALWLVKQKFQSKKTYYLKKLFGCPIACEVVLTAGDLGSLKASRGAAGKWCKILHSGHILAHKSQLQIVGFFLLKFLLDKSQGTQKLWIKRCKHMLSGHFLAHKPAFLNQLRFMCQDMPRMQDFAPFPRSASGGLERPQIPGRKDHLASDWTTKQFFGQPKFWFKFFLYRPIRNKNCL